MRDDDTTVGADGDRDAAFTASRTDRDRTLQAVHGLEAALARASGGEQWLAEVIADLERLESAMAEEQRELHRPDALLAMIVAEHPRRFRPWVRNLRSQYDDIIRQVASLRDQLEHAGESPPDAADLRQRARWIIGALHNCRARQTDLVYEALTRDLGEGTLG